MKINHYNDLLFVGFNDRLKIKQDEPWESVQPEITFHTMSKKSSIFFYDSVELEFQNYTIESDIDDLSLTIYTGERDFDTVISSIQILDEINVNYKKGSPPSSKKGGLSAGAIAGNVIAVVVVVCIAVFLVVFFIMKKKPKSNESTEEIEENLEESNDNYVNN